jgi:hypothetical protein
MLQVSPEVSKIRTVVRKRLMDESRVKAGEKALDQMLMTLAAAGFVTLEPSPPPPPAEGEPPPPPYSPERAVPTPELDKLLVFKSVHPVYGVYLVNQLGIANRDEHIQAFESVLERRGRSFAMSAFRGRINCRRGRWRPNGSIPN